MSDGGRTRGFELRLGKPVAEARRAKADRIASYGQASRLWRLARRVPVGVCPADVAQSAERVLGKDEVTGSIPVIGSIRLRARGDRKRALRRRVSTQQREEWH